MGNLGPSANPTSSIKNNVQHLSILKPKRLGYTLLALSVTAIFMPTIEDMVEYDLTWMGAEIRAVFGIKTITDAQRTQIDKIVSRYAKRQVNTVLADHIFPTAVAIGRLGGTKASKEKAIAARRNGMRGGRPKNRRGTERLSVHPIDRGETKDE
jgi:hypothetical protein